MTIERIEWTTASGDQYGDDESVTCPVLVPVLDEDDGN